MRWALYRMKCGHLSPGRLVKNPTSMHGQPIWCQVCQEDKAIYSFEKVIEQDVPLEMQY